MTACSICLIGCKTSKLDSGDRPVATEVTDEDRLQKAVQCLNSRRYNRAISAFAYLKDNGETFQTRQKAVLGLARTFLQKRQFDSALGVLQPLPECPYNEIQALQYALAGEAFLKKEQFETAGHMFETAAGVEKAHMKLYRAAVLYNLAKCCLMQGKALNAQKAIEEAEAIFGKYDQKKMLLECQRVTTELKGYLK